MCFTNFSQLKLYKQAVEVLNFYKDEREMYSEQHLVDKLFYTILIEDNISEKFFNLMETPKNGRHEKVSFLISLVSFYNLLESKSSEDYTLEDLGKIRSFFLYCFIEEKCPKVMWLWVVRLFNKFYKCIFFELNFLFK